MKKSTNSTIKKPVVKTAQKGIKAGKKTPFQKYGEKYPRFAADTLSPLGTNLHRGMVYSEKQSKDLNKAFDKTYTNYDKDWERFDEGTKYDKNLNPIGVRKPNMKKGGEVEKAKGGKWIQKAIKKPGALREQLGAKKGEPIPAGKLAAAAKKPGKLGQRARLAQTLKKMKK
jgi:hypothetical protein